jgi:hypothetical protein
MHNSTLTNASILALLREAETGAAGDELLRMSSLGCLTLYLHRRRFGGEGVPERYRLNALKHENA